MRILVWLCSIVLLAMAIPVPPAQAAYVPLCKGYGKCKKAGYPHAGYKKNAANMYWAMYAGHNCTNYVAYRMVKSGMPNKRPWGAKGDAKDWGIENREKTDLVPRVGSVAWWKSGTKPGGSSGHVAYVEEVVSATEILISEDSWGGDFHWRRVTKSDGSWPSGFIHFNDESLENTVAPAITGKPKVGVTLSASTGSWSPQADSYGFQWFRDGIAISGATGASYGVVPADRASRVSVRITARKANFVPASASSASTGPVAAGTLKNSVRPQVVGQPVFGQVLSAEPGTWSPAAAYSYQWLAAGKEVKGATSPTFKLGKGQIGKKIAVEVAARKKGYKNTSKTSAKTLVVKPATLNVTGRPTISGHPKLGARLTASAPALTARDAKATYQWRRGGKNIKKATSRKYRVKAADLGKALSVRVTLAKRGHATLSKVSAPTARVKLKPKLSMKAKSGKKRVAFAIRVKAKAGGTPRGKIVIERDGEVIKRAKLRRGEAAFVARKQKRGKHRYSATYTGSGKFVSVTAHRKLRVR